MKTDRDKWNAKYSRADAETEVCESVKRFWSLAPVKGRVLDLAAGLGTNSLFLADQGFEVDAVDISDVAMDRLKGRHPGLNCICADLDHFNISADSYDLIINTHFLNRQLFPQIIEGLKPGGFLIFETFLEGEGQAAQEETCRDYLLRPNELLQAFLKLHIIFYEEKENIPPTKATHIAILVAHRRKTMHA